jgi:hypothetical protein
MAGHSRPKDGVASLAYVPAIHALFAEERKAWMPGTRPRLSGLIFVDAAHGMDSSAF